LDLNWCQAVVHKHTYMYNKFINMYMHLYIYIDTDAGGGGGKYMHVSFWKHTGYVIKCQISTVVK